ncbi:hypothetical protein Bca101_030392 [Brassica carinata]
MGQVANSKVLLSDLKCGRCFLHRRRQVAAIVGGQECEAKSETEEDEELRSKMECDRASGGGERQAAKSNTALGGEQRSTQRRETKKAAESNGESSGRATEQWQRAMNKRH